jgi:pentalenene synthase
MPRGIDLHYPFPSRISPDYERARSVHLRWPRRFGLLEGTAETERHARADYAGLAARFYPTAVGADLDLGVDLMSWYFLFDDRFDGPLGEDLNEVRRLTEAIVHVLEHDPKPSAEPIVKAFADIWQRSCTCMSDPWRDRAAHHWRAYLSGHVTEAENRIHAVRLSADEHLRLRRDTIGVQPTIDLAERLGHYEVPARLFYSAQLTALREIAAEVDTLHNDICSVEKEEAVGDLNNMVLIVERLLGCDRAKAVVVVGQMLKDRTERFVITESAIPALCTTLYLSTMQRHAVERYLADALRTVMRGDIDWAEGSSRYDTESSETGAHPTPVPPPVEVAADSAGTIVT